MATQKVPLTRIDETGASEGEVLKYTSGTLSWETDATGGGGGGGGSGTAFKNTVLATESVSANSLEQYQVHSGLEILSGGTFMIAASGDLVLDAPDDPHKAAGWTDSGNVIHTTDSLNKIVIGQTTALSADDMLSVAGGNVTVAGSVSAQGDVYGNARTMTNPGLVLQVVETSHTETQHASAPSNVATIYNVKITPSSTSSKILLQISGVIGMDHTSPYQSGWRVYRSTDNEATTSRLSLSGAAGTTTATNYDGHINTQGYYSISSFGYMALDAPATTNECIYRIYVTGPGTVFIGKEEVNGTDVLTTTRMVAMEIAG